MNDVQNQLDSRNIDIQKVGVKDVELPLIIQRKSEEDENITQTVYAKAKMSDPLPKQLKGTHMSRFVEVLEEEREKNLLGVDIKKLLLKVRKKLNASSAYAKFDFKYFIEKEAPVSKRKSLMCYDSYFEVIYTNYDYNFSLEKKFLLYILCSILK